MSFLKIYGLTFMKFLKKKASFVTSNFLTHLQNTPPQRFTHLLNHLYGRLHFNRTFKALLGQVAIKIKKTNGLFETPYFMLH